MSYRIRFWLSVWLVGAATLFTAVILLAPPNSVVPKACAQYGGYPPPNVFGHPAYPPPGSPLQGNIQQRGGAMNGGAVVDNSKENVLIILDASYSMSDTPEGGMFSRGESKMTIAKRTIQQVLQSVSPAVNVGLRVYGTSDRRDACSASVNVSPVWANDRTRIANEIAKIEPTGMTPITLSLEQAIHFDFNGLPGKKTIILVSDGMETCHSTNPCNLAVDMVRRGIETKINVIGFGIHDFAAEKQLKCIASSTYGKYYTANTSGQLADSLNNSMNVRATVEGRLLPATEAPPAK